jgi:transposase-like protein
MGKNGHQKPDEPRARALALLELGHSCEAVGPMVGVNPSTVWRWLQRSKEVQGNKPIIERHARNAMQALDLIRDGLDLIEADETKQLALKNLVTLNMIGGTSTDKVQKDTEPQQQTQNVAIIVVNAARPDVIDGEVVDETP